MIDTGVSYLARHQPPGHDFCQHVQPLESWVEHWPGSIISKQIPFTYSMRILTTDSVFAFNGRSKINEP